MADYLVLEKRELEAENKALTARNALLEAEYTKVWDVLRTYNPRDIELEYIGFMSLEENDGTNN